MTPFTRALFAYSMLAIVVLILWPMLGSLAMRYETIGHGLHPALAFALGLFGFAGAMAAGAVVSSD